MASAMSPGLATRPKRHQPGAAARQLGLAVDRVGHRGVHEARADGIGADAIGRPFHRQHFRQHDEGGLGRAVSAGRDLRHDAGHRGQHDDRTFRPLEMRMRRLGQQPVGPEVDVEDAVPGRDIEIDQLAGRGDAGVADDGIDAAHRLHGRGHKFGGLAGPGHVGLERAHLAACGAQVGGERLEFVEIGHVAEGERLRAIGGEFQRRGTADAAAGAGDHDPHGVLPSRLASPILWGRCPRRGRRGKATDEIS